MGTFDSSWILILGLAVFVAWLGWTLLRSRRRSGRAEEAAPPVARENAEQDVAVVEAPPATAPVDVASPTPPPAPSSPPPPPAPSPAPAPAPAPAPPPAPPPPTEPAPAQAPSPAPRQMEAVPVTRGRPPPPRIERVLAVERASSSSDGEAVVVPVAAQLAQSLSWLAAEGTSGTVDGGGGSGEWVVRLPAGAAMPIAHGDLDELRALASANETSASPTRRWLDSVAAAELAAAVLAVHASERHLRPLGHEVQDLKAAWAALPAKVLGAHEARLKPLLQELTRYTRDARDSYASLIGKAAFRERVGEAASRAQQCWHEVTGLDAATREPLDALVATSRFGEVQVEKARSLLHEHRQAQRVQSIAARVLAAASLLRHVLGSAAGDSSEALDAASRVLRSSIERDGLLQQRLRAAEAGARGDPYVGRGEFEANRSALRKLLDGLGSDLAPAHARVADASAALAEGFPGERSGWLCTLHATAAGDAELHVRPLEA